MKKSSSGKGRVSANSRTSASGRSVSSGTKKTTTGSRSSASNERTASSKVSGSRAAANSSRVSSNGHAASSRSKTATAAAPLSKSQATTSSSSDDLQKVFKECLKDIYYAEKQLYKALNKMSKAAANQELKSAFETHREETAGQIEKLEEVFEILEMRAAGKKCPAMDGLVEEGSEAIEEYDKGPARDVALIVSAQKAEHYEISSYGSLRTLASTLGHDDCASIFEEIMEQESGTDEELTEIAMTVNREAMAGEEVTLEEME